MSKIIDRIQAEANDPHLLEKLLSLSKSDLNSLLLEVFQKPTSPQEILKAYQMNRFVTPSTVDPAEFHAMESVLLAAAQEMDIQTVMLSPSAPLGSCSAFGCVDQNNVVSALRGTETLSDPSNMLAIVIADKLKNHAERCTQPIHYAATARVVRAQTFSGKGLFSHFGLYCMVSSSKDTGSYTAEKELLQKHLVFYKKLMQKQFGAKLSIVLRKRSGYTDNDGFFAQMAEMIRTLFPDTPLSFDCGDVENQYYKGINFKLYMETADGQFEIGDGGFVDWTQQMLGSKKERCLISGIGLDRLMNDHKSIQK